jgi:hypothetical protein
MSVTISGEGVATGIASIVSILGAVYGFINHRRIRARCCGRNLSASIHIDDKVAVEQPVMVTHRRASTHDRRRSGAEPSVQYVAE